MIFFRLLGCILYVPRLFRVALQSSFIVLSYSAEYFVSIGPFLLLISISALLHFLFPLRSLVFGD
jgi:hypothetical protein